MSLTRSITAIALVLTFFNGFVVSSDYRPLEDKLNNIKLSLDIEGWVVQLAGDSYDYQKISSELKYELDQEYPDECFTVIVTEDGKQRKSESLSLTRYIWFNYHAATWLITVTNKDQIKKHNQLTQQKRIFEENLLQNYPSFITVEYGSFFNETRIRYLAAFSARAFSSDYGNNRYKAIADAMKRELSQLPDWGVNWNVLLMDKGQIVRGREFQKASQWAIWEYDDVAIVAWKGCDKKACGCDS